MKSKLPLLLAIALQAAASHAQTAAPELRSHPKFNLHQEQAYSGSVSREVHGVPASSAAFTLVSGFGDPLTVHLGSSKLQALTLHQLHDGDPVAVSGIVTQLGGKQILLAHQIQLGGRLLIVRNEHGMPVLPALAPHSHAYSQLRRSK